jgi:hypothetical protein
VLEDERSTPKDTNITVKVLVSDPYYSYPISKYGIIALGTHYLKAT